MRKKNFNLILLFICYLYCSLPLHALLTGIEKKEAIILNNRILAKVNGKPISTYDVMKKMDITFFRYYPQYTSLPEARYQYYQANWKSTLDELISKELIIADAQENKIEISQGDIRQEMERLFGPNIIENLDKAGLTYEEAIKIVKGDLLFQRTVAMRVQGKAIRMVTPSKIKQAYETFVQDPANTSLTIWRYQVISVRDRTKIKAEEVARIAHTLLVEENIPISQLVDTLKERKALNRKSKVTVSSIIQNNEKEMAESHKEIIIPLRPHDYSIPVFQKSRQDQSLVYRIFYLIEKIEGGVPSFKEMEAKLKEKLLNEAFDHELELYLKRLHDHFHIKENESGALVPEDYQPFLFH